VRALLASTAVPAILAVVAAIWLVIALYGGPAIYHGGDELGPLSRWPDRYRAAWTRPLPAAPSVEARDGDLLLADRESELRLNRAADEVDPSLSPGGDSLLFASNRDDGLGGFDLWIAPREGSGFGEAELLAEPVSSLFHERSPSLATLPDGSALLLFTSNRLSGLPTDHDIYLARRSPDGRFEPPLLIEELSTVADERGAALHPEGDAIVFSRPGARGIELLESHRTPHGGWSEPRELRTLSHPENGAEVRFDEGGSALLIARGGETVRSRLRILRELPEGGTPWGAWILFALAALLLIVRFLASRWRGLETLYRCLLISVLAHLLLWWWFADHGIEPPPRSGPGTPGGDLAPIELAPELFSSAGPPRASERAHGESVALAAVRAAASVLRPLATERAPIAVASAAAELPARPELAPEPSEAELAAIASPLEAPAREAPSIEAPELALRPDPGRTVDEREDPAAAATPTPRRESSEIEPLPLPSEGRGELAALPPAAAEPARVASAVESLSPPAPAPTATARERFAADDAPLRAPVPAMAGTAPLAIDPGRATPSPLERDASVPAPGRDTAAAVPLRPALPDSTRGHVESAAPTAELARIDDLERAEAAERSAARPVASIEPLAPDSARPATPSPGENPPRAVASEPAVAAIAPREIDLAPADTSSVAPASPGAIELPRVPARREGVDAASAPPPAAIPPASRGGLRPSEEESAEAARVLGHADPLAPSSPRPAASAPPVEAPSVGESTASQAAIAAAAAPQEMSFSPVDPVAAVTPSGGTPLPATPRPASRERDPARVAPAALAGVSIAPPTEEIAAAPLPPRRGIAVVAAPPPTREAASAPERREVAAAAAGTAAATGVRAATSPTSSSEPRRIEPGEIALAPLPAPAAASPSRPPPAAASPPPRADAPPDAPAPALPEIALGGAAPASDRRATGARPEEWVPWISARRGARKVEALRTGGGNERTEAAVEAGLAYLAALQRDAGGWGEPRQRHPKYGETAVGRSALALLAFLGAGHGPGMGTEHSERTERAIAWLISVQEPETGHFGKHTAAYSHAIATYALGEAVLMGAGADARAAMERGIAQILRNQEGDPNDPDRYGGWSYYYHDGHRYDEYPRVSVTVWQVMALETAELAGIDVPDAAVAAAKQWVLGQWSDRLGRFLYHLDPERLRSRYPTLPASTPGAAFILQVLGHPADDRALTGALAMIAARPPGEWREASADRFIEHGDGNSYFWYYGTLALFLRGGDAWQTWNDALQRSLLPSQDTDGSWRPICPYAGYAGDTDQERIYTTALNVLMLEVYYRYLTPFQQSLLEKR